MPLFYTNAHTDMGFSNYRMLEQKVAKILILFSWNVLRKNGELRTSYAPEGGAKHFVGSEAGKDS